MEPIIRKIINAGFGLASMVQKRTDEVIKDLMKRGKISEEEGKRILDELDKEGYKQRQEFEHEMESVLERILKKMNIPSKKDIEILEKRIDILEKEKSTGEVNK